MSTHNIGFYEDLTKNIFESSSNIIKYAPYFICLLRPSRQLSNTQMLSPLVAPVSDLVRNLKDRSSHDMAHSDYSKSYRQFSKH